MKLKTHLSPYNLLIPNMNVFTLFLPTSATSSSINSPYFVENYLTAPNEGKAYKLKSLLDTLQGSEGALTDAEIQNIHKVLKYIGYAPPDLQSLLTNPTGVSNYWSFLNSNYSNLGFDNSEFSDAAQNWAKLKMILLDESDSQIGVVTGDKPNLNLNHSGEYRYQKINYRRMSRIAMSDLLKDLYFNTGSTLERMGEMFSTGGKDQANIILLCKNPTYGGINIGYGDMHTILVNISALSLETFQTKKLSQGYSIVPLAEPLPGADFHNNNYAYMHTIAHELAHSYDVKDEYSEGVEKELSENDYITEANLVTYKTLNESSSGENKVSISKLKWNRHVYAGVAKAKFISKSENTLKMEIVDEQLDLFNKDDKLIITDLPLRKIMTSVDTLRFTNILTFSSKDGNKLLSDAPTSGLTEFKEFEEGDDEKVKDYYLLKLGIGFNGAILKFVAPAVKSKMEEINGSLTFNPTVVPLPDFENVILYDINHDNQIQEPKFKPNKFNNRMKFPDKERPYKLKSNMRNTADIIGLYVGGDQLIKGVYHPTGKCMMRLELDGTAALPLCPICSYQVILSLDYKKIEDYYKYFIPIYFIKQLNFLIP